MLIECPECARPYHVSRDDLGERGRVVICPRCDLRWYVATTDVATTHVADAAPPSFDIQPDAIGTQPDRFRVGGEVAHRPSRIRRLRPVLVACLLVGAAGEIVQARVPIVRTIPRLAALYAAAGLPVNVRGLEIVHLAPRRPHAGDATIAGEIRNISQRRIKLPRFAFEIRDANGASLVSWSEAAPAKTLAAGRTLAFASTPHDVPPDSRTVFVRFESDDSPPSSVARDPR